MTIEKIYEMMVRYLGKECSDEMIVNVIGNKFYISNGTGGQMGGGDYLINENGNIEELEIADVGDAFDVAEESGIPITTYRISKDEIKQL